MIKTHFLGLSFRRHPVLAGLIWAALFVPALLALEWLIGQPIPLRGIPKVVALAVLAGLSWGAFMAAFAARAGNDNAR